MKKFIYALLSDSGHVSMMRMMSLLCCLSAIIIAFVGLSRVSIDYQGLALLSGTFLSASFGGKLVQKRLETSEHTFVEKEAKIQGRSKSVSDKTLQKQQA